ncbi:MAG TPA: GNAT family N-acetyltransferase [Acidimicrobiales bacterium]|nr:GNAT family N-acetyltransferase [Acidimicrobiales bacterium]
MIRAATEADVPALYDMVIELAQFERLSDQVFCTEDNLRDALFGTKPVVRDTVALAADGSVAGHALWYPTFSTFLGQHGIWLEDLYIRPEHRRAGHARALMDDLRTRTDGRLEWEVLEWNAQAIDFYLNLGARPMAGWTKYRWVL